MAPCSESRRAGGAVRTGAAFSPKRGASLVRAGSSSCLGKGDSPGDAASSSPVPPGPHLQPRVWL